MTFAYFSIEIAISGGIKIFETFGAKRKSKEIEYSKETEYETPVIPEEED